MSYKSTSIKSFTGTWFGECTKVVECINCKQKLRIPIDKGNLTITCPKCNRSFPYKPHWLRKKNAGFIFLLIGGILSGLLAAYLNHFYDITNFYLLFVIPVGAIIFGLVANIGFIAALAFLRTSGTNYSRLSLVVMAGFIALFSFWLSQYIAYSSEEMTVNYISREVPPDIEMTKTEIEQMEYTFQNLPLTEQEHQRLYNQYEEKVKEVNILIDEFNRGEIGKEVIEAKKEPISKNYTFIDYVKKSYAKSSFSMFGALGKMPIATLSEDIEMGSFGLIFLLLQQIGLFFALSALWLWMGGGIKNLQTRSCGT